MHNKNQFDSHDDWKKNKHRLMVHPNFHDVLFRPHCYDTMGRLCDSAVDFRRAQIENAFPVKWVWPDEIGNLANDLKKQEGFSDELMFRYLAIATVLGEALTVVDDEPIQDAAAILFADMALICPKWKVARKLKGYSITLRDDDEAA